MDTSTVETTGESVTAPAPAEEPVNTPEIGEGSQPSGEKGEAEAQLTPKTQQRMQKLANEAREAKRLRAEYETLQRQFKEAEGAIAIDKWLREDKKRAAEFVKWMQQLEKATPQQDPYADLRPEIAEKFRSYDKLLEKIETYEAQQKADQERSVIENQVKLDEHFDKLLKDKGFADENGNVDQGLADALSEAVLARLAKTVGDPRIATEKQVTDAFEGIVKGLSALEKIALKKTVKQPGVPASGTVNGKTPSPKMDFSSQENRIAALVAGMQQRG